MTYKKSNLSNHKPAPIDRLQIGAVKVAIWKNDTANGPLLGATFKRDYRDGDGEWHSTDTYIGETLLLLSEAARAAYIRITTLKATSEDSRDTDDAA